MANAMQRMGIDAYRAAAVAAHPTKAIPNAELAKRTADRLKLGDAERANVAAAFADSSLISSLTKRELRGYAQSHRAAMQRAGLHAR